MLLALWLVRGATISMLYSFSYALTCVERLDSRERRCYHVLFGLLSRLRGLCIRIYVSRDEGGHVSWLDFSPWPGPKSIIAVNVIPKQRPLS